MAKKTRKRFTAQEKVAILRLHLLEPIPISDLCDQHGLHPTMFSRWQKEFFENGAAAFEPRSRRPADSKDQRIAALEQELPRQHEVLSELMEGHIQLKKELGEL
jgi:transposase-like protein